MTTTVPTPATLSFARPTPGSDLRRLTLLARAEVRLLTRNTTAMVNAILIPLVMAAVFALLSMGVLPLGVLVLTMITAMGLIFVVYYTLVTTLVARRQELVLKRLRTGESPAWVIIAAATVPVVGLLLVQVFLGTVATVVALGLDRPTNLVLVIAAVVLGTGVWVLLAVVSSAYTKTVESAQITTLPVLLVPLLGSGLSLPLNVMPAVVQRVAELTPLNPIVALCQLGLVGRTAAGETVDLAGSFAAAGEPLLVLVGWLVLGGWFARRKFRWDPRS